MNSRTRLHAVPLAASIAALAMLSPILLPATSWADNEIGYIEKFALAPDREKVLGELVPGSEDYYFFHALHYQNTRNEQKLADILAQWEKRYPGENARRRIILNREALLDYDATPQQTLAYLKERLGVQFNHQQEARDKKPNLPTTLDQARIARGVFEKDALINDAGLQSFTEDAVEALIKAKTPLTVQQHRAALAKLTRPDLPGLVDFIAAELKMKESGGFGQFAIHRALLPEQLDALAKLVPSLVSNDAFVYTKIRKLAPSADVEVEYDAAEREAWLDRVWAYVKTLPPAFNTLKAHTLYLRLDHDRKKGVYDAARFLEYLKLPRSLSYVNPKWLETVREKQPMADVNADLSMPLIIRRPIGDDEALVREYFLNIFQQAAWQNRGDISEKLLDPYTDYVRESWLKPVFAEAVITSGFDKTDRWASFLTPQAFQQLKDRVDIEFPRTNAQFFAPGEDVQFDVTLKNTQKLIIKIYELNALNFFLTQRRQLNTDLSLDGLVANSERTETFDNGPFTRLKQPFKFPELKGRRGAWIVEFIGGGRSSRALVRVGQWQVVQTTSPAGDILTVLDEKGDQVKDAVVWLDGRKYTPDEKLGSRIVVPFSAQPGLSGVVLADPAGTFATLTQFERHAEAYALDAQFHIEREQLLARREATLVVRPALTLGESQIDPGLLSEPRLTITSATLDGITTTREVKDLKLGAGGVLTYQLSVPERLATLVVTFYAKVDIASAGGEKRDVSAAHTWNLNGMDKTQATNDGHLSKFEGAYVYELLGKNGEPVADQQVVFTMKYQGFTRPQTIALKTDEKGRIALGALAGIKSFHAKAPNGRDARWELDEFERTWASAIHTAAGQVVRVPLPPSITGVLKLDGLMREGWLRESVSLLQVNAGTYTADLGAKMKAEAGFLVIEGLAPGDYSLRLRGEQRDIAIKVSGGKLSNGWYLGASRNLEAKAEKPLQVIDVAMDKEFITIKLANANAFTRVHIAATRFEPGRGIFAGLGGFTRFGAGEGAPARLPNLYSAGREIGDEYRYILDRRYAKAFPGNMLTRPGLLLNPWAVRDTNLEELRQQAGQQAGGTAGGRGGALRRAGAEPKLPEDPGAVPGGAAADTNIDFLAAVAPTLYNLLPEKDGTVKIARKALGDRQHVQIYAEDLTNAVWQSFSLPEAGTKFTDLRLARALDPAKPFTQKKEITVLEQGKALTLADILTSEMEAYDTLSGIHSLFSTLNHDSKLAEFAWLLQWPKLKDDEKRAKYSEYACHEVNFFLAKKDPDFFAKVIKPYLANKKDKTFMDDFLLGADMAKYLQPSVYVHLNTVECALLAQRLPAESAGVSRNLRELWELVPPNPERADQLFETALRGRELESGGEEGKLGESLKREKGKAEGNVKADDRMEAMPKPAAAAPPTPMPPASPAGAPAARYKESLEKLQANRQLGLAATAKDMESLDEVTLSEARKNAPEAAAALGGFRGRDGALKKAAAMGGGVKLEVDKDGDGLADLSTDTAYFGAMAGKDAKARYRALYRQLGVTKEWAENNYYHLRIAQQDERLVGINAFWRDYAAHVAGGNKGPFVSPNVAEASSNFTEIMLALAVLDLPFDAPKHTTKTEGAQFTLTAGGPVIIYHKEIKPAAPPAAAPQGQLLVSQSFFREGDRYRQEGNEKFEKYVSEEFLTGAVYGANVVVTNPTSSPAKAEVLLQIPQGALPVLGSKATQSRYVRLEPYTTKTFEYYFYFPAVSAKAGTKFSHFPVNVAVANTAAAAAKPFEFNVVSKLTQVDKASWDYVSQYGTDDEVFAFLDQNNLASLNFVRVAWRCKDAAFFKKLTGFLHTHHIWDSTIYSYALMHNDAAALREWLKHHDQFVSQCGPFLSTKLILLDPIERRSYEQLEYSPLVNQRAHKLGAEARIANPAVLGQYQSLLNILAHKPQLDAVDAMSVTYYQFLQDRVDEGLTRFHAIDAKQLPTAIQHDYFQCYADFYESNLADARGIASKYADHPVTRWRKLFAEVTSQLDEIEGKAAAKKPDDKPDREKDQAGLASTEPSFEFKVENKTIALTWKNLGDVTINYYLMDPEFSFSSNPFVSEDASRFAIIKPNKTAKQELPKGKDTLDVTLPAEYAKANVLVEVVGAGQRKAQPYHANTLKLTVTENYGLLETRDSGNDKPVSKAYVKVYARLKNGTVRFFKDGYTDLRGRFDYASLNGSPNQVQPVAAPEPAPKNGLDYQMLKPAELDNIEKLSILILSETNGATTREVNPPKQ
jgi:hypothetical protein